MGGSVPKFSMEVGAQIRADYEGGDTADTLADRYRTTQETIRATIRRVGGAIRPRGGSKPGHRKPAVVDYGYDTEVVVTDTRPHGAKHIPALDWRLTREERARRSLASYFSNEEGRR